LNVEPVMMESTDIYYTRPSLSAPWVPPTLRPSSSRQRRPAFQPALPAPPTRYSGNEHGLVKGIGVVSCLYVNLETGEYGLIDWRFYDPAMMELKGAPDLAGQVQGHGFGLAAVADKVVATGEARRHKRETPLEKSRGVSHSAWSLTFAGNCYPD
jgi:hypothetical protein